MRERGRHPLPSAKRFAAAAGRAGIGPGVYVVAYGSGGGPERLWWLLRHFGHDDCAVLLGGIDVWGGELRAGEEEIEPAEFVPRERSGDTIEADEIARRLADPSLALVDARTPNRWRGEPNEIDDPAGRIPGAANAPWNEPATGASRRRARRLLRLRSHRVRHAPPGLARGPRRSSLPGLVERVVEARPAARTRIANDARPRHPQPRTRASSATSASAARP